MTPLGAGPAQSARYTPLLVLIGVGLSAFWWTSSAGDAGPLPLLFAAPAFVIALVPDRTLLRRTPLDLPLLLFLASAVVAMWAAYDPDVAQSKFWMLVAAFVLFYALALQPAHNLPAVSLLFGALGLAVALFFLLTHDWETFPAKFGFVQRLARGWSAIRPTTALQPLHPNIAGSLMAMLAPFQLALVARVRRRHHVQLLVGGFAVLITLLSLVLTSSRGAILALAAGLALWFAWQQALRRRALLRRHRRLLLLLLTLSLTAGVLLIAGNALWPLARLLDRLPGPASALSRAQLASHTLDLISDYAITGGGLAAFPGLYSHYILGIPVYFLPNGHNILLDITLEQGVLGALSFTLVAVTTIWLLVDSALPPNATAARPFHSTVTGAALASFVILLVHGMVEDTVYGSAALPLLLVAPGIAVAATGSAGTTQPQIRRWDRRHAAIVAVAATVLLAGAALPRGQALWASNLGAIRMARAELAGFPSGKWVYMQESDELRRAADHFKEALRRNPQQRTALHRLGLLALQRGDFAVAVDYLQRAYHLDPFHVGVRKALGYSYAWSGDLQHAHELLATAPFVAQELDGYISWWQQHGRRELAQTAVQMRAALQNSETQTAIE